MKCIHLFIFLTLCRYNFIAHFTLNLNKILFSLHIRYFWIALKSFFICLFRKYVNIFAPIILKSWDHDALHRDLKTFYFFVSGNSVANIFVSKWVLSQELNFSFRRQNNQSQLNFTSYDFNKKVSKLLNRLSNLRLLWL